jgi:hypothetical protein
VLRCQGHKGLRLLIESYPPSVKVYPQVERDQIFSIIIIIIIIILEKIIYLFSSLECEKKENFKKNLRKKNEEIPFSLTK